MPRKRYQTRLDEDVAEKVDEYQEEVETSKAGAVRELIKLGIEAAEAGETLEDDEDEIRTRLEKIEDLIRQQDADEDTNESEYRIQQAQALIAGSVLGLLVYLIPLETVMQLLILVVLAIPSALAIFIHRRTVWQQFVSTYSQLR
jgi:F0F1-type ATP synthase assembly protein I